MEGAATPVSRKADAGCGNPAVSGVLDTVGLFLFRSECD
jgi:hypothetical protein